MIKAEKLSPSSTYSKRESTRAKMILEAVKRPDENAIKQNASGNTVMKIDGTVETDREKSEIDGNRQVVSNQRSSRIKRFIRMHQRQP